MDALEAAAIVSATAITTHLMLVPSLPRYPSPPTQIVVSKALTLASIVVGLGPGVVLHVDDAALNPSRSSPRPLIPPRWLCPRP